MGTIPLLMVTYQFQANKSGPHDIGEQTHACNSGVPANMSLTTKLGSRTYTLKSQKKSNCNSEFLA